MTSDFLDNYDPKYDDLETKYCWGENVPYFAKLEHFTPLFAFDFISLNASQLCFNNPLLKSEDFIRLFCRKKEISRMSYTELYKGRYRFHHVDLNDKKRNFLKKELFKLAQKDGAVNISTLPEIFQFEVFTDEKIHIAHRVLGFIGKLGVFYPIWYDSTHCAYPEKHADK